MFFIGLNQIQDLLIQDLLIQDLLNIKLSTVIFIKHNIWQMFNILKIFDGFIFIQWVIIFHHRIVMF